MAATSNTVAALNQRCIAAQQRITPEATWSRKAIADAVSAPWRSEVCLTNVNTANATIAYLLAPRVHVVFGIP